MTYTMDKLTYGDVYDHDFGELGPHIEGWKQVASELKDLAGEFLGKVARPIAESGWTGPEKTPKEIAEMAVQFRHAAREAAAIRDALTESYGLFVEGQVRLHTTALVLIPLAGFTIDEDGVVADPEPWKQILDPEREKRLAELQEEIENARDLAKEADENAARVLDKNVRREPVGFDWPKEPTLKVAEAQKSEERFSGSERYIFGEMKKNIHRSEVDEMREDNESSNPVRWGEAAALWKSLVESGAEWDHKPKLEEQYGLDSEIDKYFKIPGDKKGRVAYFDIWSNIHYGYVGTAAGFSRWLLQKGAEWAPGAGTNDEGDVLSIDLGINLWNSDKGGEALPFDEFQAAVQRLIGDLQKAKDDGEEITQIRGWRYSGDVL